MLGITGDGYVGNCNVNVLPSSSTIGLTQDQVDRSENGRQLSKAFFQNSLRTFYKDVEVLDAKPIRRGAYLGQLVNYTYSFHSPTLNQPLHMRAELFSHSQPGRVFSFTCNTGAISPAGAQAGFNKERLAFERISASLITSK